MNLLKTQGLVLNNYDLSEQDKIVVFYTPSGMLKVVAKGARRVKSRFAPMVHLPSYSDLLIYKKPASGMGTLGDCRIRYLFPEIRRDIFRFAYASYLAEIFLSFLKEGKKNKGLFYLLLKTLFLLEWEKRENFRILTLSFKLKFLRLMGYAPELRRCINCGKDRSSFKLFHFAPLGGGILCESCQREEEQAIGVPRLTVLAMDYLLHAQINRSFVPKIHQVERQIQELLQAYFCCHLGEKKAGKSFIFIQVLEKSFSA